MSASQTHFVFNLLKGNFEGGKQAIAHGEFFANALPPVLLKGNFEGGKKGDRPSASASQTRLEI